MKKFGVFANN